MQFPAVSRGLLALFLFLVDLLSRSQFPNFSLYFYENLDELHDPYFQKMERYASQIAVTAPVFYRWAKNNLLRCNLRFNFDRIISSERIIRSCQDLYKASWVKESDCYSQYYSERYILQHMPFRNVLNSWSDNNAGSFYRSTKITLFDKFYTIIH